MTGITFLKDQILSRSSKKWFDITPVAGTRKARKRLRAFFIIPGMVLNHFGHPFSQTAAHRTLSHACYWPITVRQGLI